LRAFLQIADETVDITRIDQLAICVRYLHKDTDKLKIWEDILGFIPIKNVTGGGFSKVILKFTESSGIDCTYSLGKDMIVRKLWVANSMELKLMCQKNIG